MHMHSNSGSLYSWNISSSHSLPCWKVLELLIGCPLKQPFWLVGSPSITSLILLLMCIHHPEWPSEMSPLRGGVYMNYHPSTGGGWVTLSLWTGRLCLVTQTRRRSPSLDHSYTRPPVSSSVICASERECAVCPPHWLLSYLLPLLFCPTPHHCSLLFQLRSWLPARITISFFVAAQHRKKQRDRQETNNKTN